MAVQRKKFFAIDFRPRRQKRYRYLTAALLLLAGMLWWGWHWISPYNRALVIEKQLATVTPQELEPLFATLPSLEAPGYRVLFGALGHAEPEVRRAARTSIGALLDRWQREPTQQPKILAALTIMLAERASSFSEAERLEAQDIFRRWVNLASPEKVSANLAQREFHARRLMLEWVATPRLAQPPRLRAQERAQRQRLLRETIVSTIREIELEAAQLTTTQAQVDPPKGAINETKFQIVTLAEPLQTKDSPSLIGVQAPTELKTSGGVPNQPVQLSRGPNSEAQPITRLSVAMPDNETARQAPAATLSSADLLSSDAPARYRQAAPVTRRQLREEYQAAGIPEADLTLLDLFATAGPAVLSETINALPQRLDVEGQLWLRQFGMHPDSTVRRMAWSWLITSPDRSTRQWLAERAATDGDGDLRQWYQTMTKQRKLR